MACQIRIAVLLVQAGSVRALTVFEGGRRILFFPENGEGGVLERAGGAPQAEAAAAASPAAAPGPNVWVMRSSVAVAEAVSDFVLADCEVWGPGSSALNPKTRNPYRSQAPFLPTPLY